MEFASKFLVILFGIVLFTSCSESNTEPNTIFIEASSFLRIKNSDQTVNFLNTINTNTIEIYYKKEGVLTRYIHGGDMPYAFNIVQEPPINEKLIIVQCYIGGNNNHEETYIKWNETDMDTLSYDITRYKTGSIAISSLKYNSVVLANNYENGAFNVIKN
jgi:hypothetical protein